MILEFEFRTLPGVGMLVLLLSVIGVAIYLIATARGSENPKLMIAAGIAILTLDLLMMLGLFMIAPNTSGVVTLFGQYKGTVRAPGLHYANPFMGKQKVSLRVRNFETTKLKVNDHDGNPIEIAAVVVWKVVDAAEALFEVDHYEYYVEVQCESALRNLATAFPYDAHQENQKSLRANGMEVAAQLKVEIEERVMKAGIDVV